MISKHNASKKCKRIELHRPQRATPFSHRVPSGVVLAIFANSHFFIGTDLSVPKTVSLGPRWPFPDSNPGQDSNPGDQRRRGSNPGDQGRRGSNP